MAAGSQGQGSTPVAIRIRRQGGGDGVVNIEINRDVGLRMTVDGHRLRTGGAGNRVRDHWRQQRHGDGGHRRVIECVAVVAAVDHGTVADHCAGCRVERQLGADNH